MFLYDEKDVNSHVITRRTFLRWSWKIPSKNSIGTLILVATALKMCKNEKFFTCEKWKFLKKKSSWKMMCLYKKPNLMHIWSLTYSLGTIGKCISVVPIFYPCFPQRKYPILTSKRKNIARKRSQVLCQIYFLRSS